MKNSSMKNPSSLKNLAAHAALALAMCLPMAPAHAGNMSCENESGFSKIACHALMGTILVVGGTVAVVSSVKQAVTPDTKVKVLLPSGEIISGKLTAMAIQSKDIKDGDTVRLDCKQNPARTPNAKETDVKETGAKGYSMCEIYFSNPLTGQAEPYPHYATIGEDGIPQESVIKLERPLRWVDGKAI